MEKLVRKVFLIVALVLAMMTTLAARPATQPVERLQFRLVAASESDPDAEDLPMVNAPEKILHVLKQVELDDRDVESAKAESSAGGGGRQSR